MHTTSKAINVCKGILLYKCSFRCQSLIVKMPLHTFIYGNSCIPHLDLSEQRQPQHPLKKIGNPEQQDLHLPQHWHSHLLQMK